MFGSSDDEGDDEVYESQSEDDSASEDKYADPIDLDGHNYPQWVKNILGCRLQTDWASEGQFTGIIRRYDPDQPLKWLLTYEDDDHEWFNFTDTLDWIEIEDGDNENQLIRRKVLQWYDPKPPGVPRAPAAIAQAPALLKRQGSGKRMKQDHSPDGRSVKAPNKAKAQGAQASQQSYKPESLTSKSKSMSTLTMNGNATHPAAVNRPTSLASTVARLPGEHPLGTAPAPTKPPAIAGGASFYTHMAETVLRPATRPATTAAAPVAPTAPIRLGKLAPRPITSLSATGLASAAVPSATIATLDPAKAAAGPLKRKLGEGIPTVPKKEQRPTTKLLNANGTVAVQPAARKPQELQHNTSSGSKPIGSSPPVRNALGSGGMLKAHEEGQVRPRMAPAQPGGPMPTSTAPVVGLVSVPGAPPHTAAASTAAAAAAAASRMRPGYSRTGEDGDDNEPPARTSTQVSAPSRTTLAPTVTRLPAKNLNAPHLSLTSSATAQKTVAVTRLPRAGSSNLTTSILLGAGPAAPQTAFLPHSIGLGSALGTVSATDLATGGGGLHDTPLGPSPDINDDYAAARRTASGPQLDEYPVNQQKHQQPPFGGFVLAGGRSASTGAAPTQDMDLFLASGGMIGGVASAVAGSRQGPTPNVTSFKAPPSAYSTLIQSVASGSAGAGKGPAGKSATTSIVMSKQRRLEVCFEHMHSSNNSIRQAVGLILDAVTHCGANTTVREIFNRVEALTGQLTALPPPSNDPTDAVETQRVAILRHRLSLMHLMNSLLSLGLKQTEERARDLPRLIGSVIVSHARKVLALGGENGGDEGMTIRKSLIKMFRGWATNKFLESGVASMLIEVLDDVEKSIGPAGDQKAIVRKPVVKATRPRLICFVDEPSHSSVLNCMVNTYGPKSASTTLLGDQYGTHHRCLMLGKILDEEDDIWVETVEDEFDWDATAHMGWKETWQAMHPNGEPPELQFRNGFEHANLQRQQQLQAGRRSSGPPAAWLAQSAVAPQPANQPLSSDPQEQLRNAHASAALAASLAAALNAANLSASLAGSMSYRMPQLQMWPQLSAAQSVPYLPSGRFGPVPGTSSLGQNPADILMLAQQQALLAAGSQARWGPVNGAEFLQSFPPLALATASAPAQLPPYQAAALLAPVQPHADIVSAADDVGSGGLEADTFGEDYNDITEAVAASDPVSINMHAAATAAAATSAAAAAIMPKPVAYHNHSGEADDMFGMAGLYPIHQPHNFQTQDPHYASLPAAVAGSASGAPHPAMQQDMSHSHQQQHQYDNDLFNVPPAPTHETRPSSGRRSDYGQDDMDMEDDEHESPISPDFASYPDQFQPAAPPLPPPSHSGHSYDHRQQHSLHGDSPTPPPPLPSSDLASSAFAPTLGVWYPPGTLQPQPPVQVQLLQPQQPQFSLHPLHPHPTPQQHQQQQLQQMLMQQQQQQPPALSMQQLLFLQQQQGQQQLQPPLPQYQQQPAILASGPPPHLSGAWAHAHMHPAPGPPLPGPPLPFNNTLHAAYTQAHMHPHTQGNMPPLPAAPSHTELPPPPPPEPPPPPPEDHNDLPPLPPSPPSNAPPPLPAANSQPPLPAPPSIPPLPQPPSQPAPSQPTAPFKIASRSSTAHATSTNLPVAPQSAASHSSRTFHSEQPLVAKRKPSLPLPEETKACTMLPSPPTQPKLPTPDPVPTLPDLMLKFTQAAATAEQHHRDGTIRRNGSTGVSVSAEREELAQLDSRQAQANNSSLGAGTPGGHQQAPMETVQAATDTGAHQVQLQQQQRERSVSGMGDGSMSEVTASPTPLHASNTSEEALPTASVKASRGTPQTSNAAGSHKRHRESKNPHVGEQQHSSPPASSFMAQDSQEASPTPPPSGAKVSKQRVTSDSSSSQSTSSGSGSSDDEDRPVPGDASQKARAGSRSPLPVSNLQARAAGELPKKARSVSRSRSPVWKDKAQAKTAAAAAAAAVPKVTGWGDTDEETANASVRNKQKLDGRDSRVPTGSELRPRPQGTHRQQQPLAKGGVILQHLDADEDSYDNGQEQDFNPANQQRGSSRTDHKQGGASRHESGGHKQHHGLEETGRRGSAAHEHAPSKREPQFETQNTSQHQVRGDRDQQHRGEPTRDGWRDRPAHGHSGVQRGSDHHHGEHYYGAGGEQQHRNSDQHRGNDQRFGNDPLRASGAYGQQHHPHGKGQSMQRGVLPIHLRNAPQTTQDGSQRQQEHQHYDHRRDARGGVAGQGQSDRRNSGAGGDRWQSQAGGRGFGPVPPLKVPSRQQADEGEEGRGGGGDRWNDDSWNHRPSKLDAAPEHQRRGDMERRSGAGGGSRHQQDRDSGWQDDANQDDRHASTAQNDDDRYYPHHDESSPVRPANSGRGTSPARPHSSRRSQSAVAERDSQGYDDELGDGSRHRQERAGSRQLDSRDMSPLSPRPASKPQKVYSPEEDADLPFVAKLPSGNRAEAVVRNITLGSSASKVAADSPGSSLHTPTAAFAAKPSVSRFSKVSPAQQSPPHRVSARHSGSQDPEPERPTPKGRALTQAVSSAGLRDTQRRAQPQSPAEAEGYSARTDHSKRRRDPVVWKPPPLDPVFSADAGERSEPEFEEADKGIESGSAKRARLLLQQRQQGMAEGTKRKPSGSLEHRLDRSEQQAASGHKAPTFAPKHTLGEAFKLPFEHSDEHEDGEYVEDRHSHHSKGRR